MIEVRRAGSADRRAVAQVLGAAFRDDPVVRWLLPSGERSTALMSLLARWMHGRRGGTDIAERDGVAVGAALWDAPGERQSVWEQIVSGPSFVRVLRHRVVHAQALENAFHQARPPGPFWYLATIGAHPRGLGAGSGLLEHRLAGIDGPAYLESSNEANIGLYERFGFRLQGEIHLPFHGPTCWPMLRD